MKKVLFTTDSAENLHTLWKSFIYDPPEGYCYYNFKGKVIIRKNKERSTVNENTEKGIFNQAKPFYWKTLRFTLRNNLINQLAKGFSSKILSKKINKLKLSPDIIYSINGQFIKNKIPWVVDVENVGVFTMGYNYKALHKERYKRYIEKRLSSEYCKKILPYSETAKNSILANLNCENFIHKIEVVPNAVKFKENLNKIPHDSFNILFSGTSNAPAMARRRDFYTRGGREVIMSFLRLRERYPKMKLICRCIIPEEIKKMITGIKNIEIYEHPIPKNKFEELFLKSDVYLFPAFAGFAVSILDAMNYGLPIITTDFLENGEKVDNFYNGFEIPLRNNLPRHHLPYVPAKPKPIQDKEFIKVVCDKIQYLYENESERIKMGENSRKVLKSKFSLEVKNKLLKKIYDNI